MSLVIRCFVLAEIAAAVSNGAQDTRQRNMMRAETGHKEPEALGIGPEGELFDMGSRPEQWKQMGSRNDHQLGNDPEITEVPCDNQYPIGPGGTSTCPKAHQNLIIDPLMCKEAASKSNASLEDKQMPEHPGSFDHFMIDEAYYGDHPEGCFAAPCQWIKDEAGNQATCYFYNQVGQDPCSTGEPAPSGSSGGGGATGNGGDTGNGGNAGGNATGNATSFVDVSTSSGCTGIPVCYAAHYLYLTHSGNVPAGAHCGGREGFEVIIDETRCKSAASCLGREYAPHDKCTGINLGTDFYIGVHNKSQHLDYPYGCFLNAEDNCFYLNIIPEELKEKLTAPVGTPICESIEVGHNWLTDAHPGFAGNAPGQN